MTRADKFLIVAVFLCALFGFVKIYRYFFASAESPVPVQATITTEGKVFRSMALHPAAGRETLKVSGRLGTATVEVADGKIRMLDANCPEQICVKQGWIQAPGAAIVCLPGEIIIKIDGQTTVDAITR